MKIILIVGPSGAGKDSLLKICKQSFSSRDDILFVPRYVTRMPDDNERNYYVDESAFNTLKQNGFFFIDWRAHGNLYGIGLDPLFKKDTHAVIISVSRTVVDAFETVFRDVDTLVVSAPDTVLKKRLVNRDRESAEARHGRLARSGLETRARSHFCFNNDGPLEEMASRFIQLMETILSSPSSDSADGEGDLLPSGKQEIHRREI